MSFPVGIVLQCIDLGAADLAGLAAFDGGVCLVCGWPEETARTLARLDEGAVRVSLLRYAVDPRLIPGWPGEHLRRCDLAVFHNEEDIEGPKPQWYGAAYDAWRAAGGKVAEPAWSDESKRVDDGREYDYITCHCYAGNFDNLRAARRRADSG